MNGNVRNNLASNDIIALNTSTHLTADGTYRPFRFPLSRSLQPLSQPTTVLQIRNFTELTSVRMQSGFINRAYISEQGLFPIRFHVRHGASPQVNRFLKKAP